MMQPADPILKPDAIAMRAVMFGISAGLSCWTLLLWRCSPEQAFGLWLVFMTFLVFRFTLAVYALVGTVVMWPMFYRQTFAAHLAANVPETSSILFTIILLLFTWFGFGFVDALNNFPYFRQVKADHDRNHPTPVYAPSRGAVATSLSMIPVAVFLAVLALVCLPEISESRHLYRLTPGGFRAITFIWAIGISWILVKTIFGLIGWFRLGRDEATIYVRNIFGHEIRRDLGSIERIRARNKYGSRRFG